jgi:hypothetical protein
MKIKLLFLMLFTTALSFAQIKKIGELSNNKFLSSRIVFDDNQKDIYGYFLLFEKDRTSKKEFVLEYVFLDKNLNKVASNIFTSHRNRIMGAVPKIVLRQVIKKENTLYFSTGEYYDSGLIGEGTVGNLFRQLDLTTFEMKPSYEIFAFNKIEKDSNLYVGASAEDESEPMQYINLKSDGLLLINKTDDYYRTFQNEFKYIDNNGVEKWTNKYNQEKKGFFQNYSFIDSDKKDILFSLFSGQGKVYKKSIVLISNETGKLDLQIPLQDSLNVCILKKVILEEDKVIVFKQIYDYRKGQAYVEDQIRGFVKLIYDRTTGKELSRSYFKWTDLVDKLPINKSGKIKGNGYIQFLDFQRTSDGKTIVIAEGFDPSVYDVGKLFNGGGRSQDSSYILDLYLFVFNEKMEVIDYHKVAKNKNKFKGDHGFGDYLQNVGAFDYMYSQTLSKDEFVYYYQDNEKNSKRNPQWVLGVITYVNGAFAFQKVPLTNKNGQIIPHIAKNGYILLEDNSETESELRLEKIDY